MFRCGPVIGWVFTMEVLCSDPGFSRVFAVEVFRCGPVS
jgi:hypothetical protein